MFLEVCMRFIFNLDNPSYILVILVKSQYAIEKIHQKYSNLYSKKIKTENCDISWNLYVEIKNRFDILLERIKDIIKKEGGDFKFTLTSEVK